ncbi:hypothetical protein B0H16DRAFT_1482688 [Mycena metata]|uniref:Uncharacterized protein n=1 Tax=Mycena metata TaxID=1033252 RepID=A0AAD7GSA9_9AGAR|nr:hypothetical protein B0H16DRAFT_1482688 [Mycena metata]
MSWPPLRFSTTDQTPATPAQAPAPTVIVASAPPSPPGVFLTRGPWVAGALYVVVPTAPLLGIAEEALDDDVPAWYAIIRGRYVGVTLSNALALNATTGVSAGSMRKYKTQALAVAAFNEMLQYRLAALLETCRLLDAAEANWKLGWTLEPTDTLGAGLAFPSLIPTFDLRAGFITDHHSALTVMSTERDSSPDYGDRDLINLIANLDLSTIDPAPTSPQTPPPAQPHVPTERHTFPSLPSRSVRAQQTIYQFELPTRRGYSTDWSTAGFATQAVPGARVHAVQRLGSKKKKSGKKPPTSYSAVVHVAFSRRVTGVPNSIFRGYPTVSEAQAAFEYANSRGWIRFADRPVTSGIARLPQPINIQDTLNALNNDTDFDGRWYIVYRGITPGVYRSHLESQLNTVGVQGALHESVEGLSAAIEKYTNATSRGETVVAPPPHYHDVFS